MFTRSLVNDKIQSVKC